MTAREYHDLTKHSYESVRRNPHSLDWANQPLGFKIYPTLEPIPLPREFSATATERLRLEDLARLLYFSAGITKRRAYPGGEILFRAAACTGALYEIELYVVCGGAPSMPDLPAGVYHFGPGDFALRRLREGDFRGAVAGAPAAPLLLIASGTYWRNAWKYQARTYRHFGWDNGTIHANLLAVAAALGLEARLCCGFVDEQVNRLLGLDTDREVALTVLALGTSASPPAPPEAPPIHFETVPLSKQEVDYPAMREMHQASSLGSLEEVVAWRGELPTARPRAESLPGEPIEQVILRRGSTRRFARHPITLTELRTILDQAAAGGGFLADFAKLNELYLIVNAVEGLEAGAYFHHAAGGALEPLALGDFRRLAAHLGLDQDLPGDAAAAVFFLADLNHVLGRYGNRGYRAVQLEAGILGGRMYLAAYAQRLGATGLTFYDDDVTGFFSPHAAGKSAIFLMAIGHPARRKP